MNNTKFSYQKSFVNITTADKFVDLFLIKLHKKKINRNLKILEVLVQLLIYQKFIKNQNL